MGVDIPKRQGGWGVAGRGSRDTPPQKALSGEMSKHAFRNLWLSAVPAFAHFGSYISINLVVLPKDSK